MSRRAVRLVALSAAALAGMAAPALGSPVVTLDTVRVKAPGNPSVGIVPFTDAIYRSCQEAPESPRGCQEVGRVDYDYEIGRIEITVRQWVAFLNTVDPGGSDPRDLYDSTQSSSAWPKYGQINLAPSAPRGEHYSVASPEWADKPYGFANFLRAARFVNSLSNGRVLARRETARGVSYRVRLSRQTERGMYDLAAAPRATRTSSVGFVVPSQDEWIKAAYYDPRGGGAYSYWKYPTNPGTFGDGIATAPGATVLNPSTGDVTNAGTQPLATYHPNGGAAPTWCPAAVSSTDCLSVNPFGLDPATYARLYQGNLSTVAQARTTSPWGTLDQGGNAVEWTDTITPPPARDASTRVWRRLHGGVTNAGAYQMWPSAIGLQPQDNAFFDRTYPWLGFRIGVIGDPKPDRARTRAAPPSAAPRALYVANRPSDGPASLAQLSVAVPVGAASPLTPLTVAADPEPQHVAVTSDARFAYASAAGAGVVDVYRVKPQDGALASLGSAPAAPGAHGVVVAPGDRSVYVANQDAGTVSQYDVGAGGALTPKTPAGVPAGAGASGVAVAPDGRSVYVTNLEAGTVSQYDVDPANGTLAAKSPDAVQVPARPSGIGVSPDGRSLYVATLSGRLAQYDVDPGSGRLRPKSPATVRAGIGAAGVAITPDGRFLYTPNGGSGSASQFAIDRGSGRLTPLRPAAVPAGARPEGAAITPDGRTLYVVDADGGGVSRFAIDARTGRLAAGAGLVATGPNPHGAVVTPDRSPVARLSLDPVAGVGEPVRLDGSASRDPDGRVARYAWSLGDGDRAAGEAPTAVHRYRRPGRYRVTLKVTDDEGCSARSVYTGQTASCGGGPGAIATRNVTVR
jgi:6-phosphogluconolactonase (cycloisomerase 2 family)